MTTVLICGGRTFTDTKSQLWAKGAHERDYMRMRLEQLWEKRKPNLLVHGGAYGADQYAGNFAKEKECNQYVVPAKWKKQGKAAGQIRNTEMLNLLVPIDLVVAFPGGDWNTRDDRQGQKGWN